MRPGAGSLLESVIRLHGDKRRRRRRTTKLASIRAQINRWPPPHHPPLPNTLPPHPFCLFVCFFISFLAGFICLFAAYLALLHARPHRICPRLVFLTEELKVLVFLLGVLVVALVRLDAQTAAVRVAVAERVEAAVQIVRTRRAVQQIQQGVGVTKGKVQIAHIYSPRPLSVGKAPAQLVGIQESKAVVR